MKQAVAAFVAGVLFAVGLAISGMTDPSKIGNFLDVAGAWDPSLMFVMVGALAVYAPANYFIRRRAAPVLAPRFSPLPEARVDAKLIGGSALFGIGWGLSGWCPGPALATVLLGVPQLLLFVGAMILGFVLHDFVLRRRHAPTDDATAALQ